MNCCQCQGIACHFNQKATAKKLRQYRQKGPDPTTRLLIEALKTEGVPGLTLLDIGGGIGAIQFALLDAGVVQATGVEASPAYVEAAREEAHRCGQAGRINLLYGNFIDLAPDIPPADIVTLDRVICCYHDMPQLVELSSVRATKLYGLVYPRDRWWVRLGYLVENFLYWLQRTSFRVYLHPTEAVETILQANGWQRCFYKTHGVWQVVLYSR
jgi:magnesium-protoporphyrin O-methyltransferase